MSKQVTHIDCPAEFGAIDDYSSHRPLLWLCMDKLKPDFAVECGIGHGSTTLIDGGCKKFIAFETDFDWYNKFLGLINGLVFHIDKWDIVKPIEADFLFVDCKPGESRRDIIKKCQNTSKVIVAHDTEPGANYVYGMAEVLSTFKYRVDYCPEGKPWATAVSNFVNIEEWV